MIAAHRTKERMKANLGTKGKETRTKTTLAPMVLKTRNNLDVNVREKGASVQYYINTIITHS